MASPGKLVADIYGPSELNTTVNGRDVRIKQHTNYPFSDGALLEITVDQPAFIELYLRKPAWTEHMTVTTNAARYPSFPFE